MANILVVDDVPEVRAHIKKTVEILGHKVVEAQNGNEGIRLIKANKFDIVILDLIMPEKGGIETLLEIKKFDKIKKIIITGMVTSGSSVLNDLVTRLGASNVLFKPFRKSELINAINCLM
ncbi:MAG: response regulator [Spirochaetes bacterium]|nr:response regulator [Spirochaetota bacterium]